MGVLIDRIVANRKTHRKIQYKTNRYFPSFRKHKVKHVSQWISIICYLLAWTTIVGQYLQWVHFIMKFRWEWTMSSTSAPTSLVFLTSEAHKLVEGWPISLSHEIRAHVFHLWPSFCSRWRQHFFEHYLIRLKSCHTHTADGSTAF